MAFAQSHKIEYKDYTDIDTRIEIWEDGYTGPVTECEAGEDPLNVNIAPMDPTILTPVIGSGATIALNSATNGQLTGLYTINPVKRMIKLFKNNQANPWWLGYLNTEQYGEGYSRLENYPVTINCNDGFNVLNRFKYVDGNGANYTTLEVKWNILARILTKMGLPFQYLFFACGHTCDGVTIGASETLFHNLKVDQNNYNNEQNEPMNHRQVLETLLVPYGLQIRWHKGSILVYQPQMLTAASFSAQRYDSFFTYLDTVSLSLNYDISLGDINWDNEDQIKEIMSGFSRQKIRYSPYLQDGVIKEYDIKNRYIWTGTETWTQDGFGIQRLSGISSIAGHALYSGDIPSYRNCVIAGHRRSNNEDTDIYFQKDMRSDDKPFLTLTSGRNIAMRQGQFIIVTGQVYIQSKANEFSDGASVLAATAFFPMYVRIGGKGVTYNEITGEWDWATGDGGGITGLVTNMGTGSVCDKWLEWRALIPWNIPTGIIEIELLDPKVYRYYLNDTRLLYADGLLNIRMKDFKARVFENGTLSAGGGIAGYEKTNEIENNDALYTGTLNIDFINEGPEIILNHADSVSMIDRGLIMKLDGAPSTGWRKQGDLISYRLVDLLLRAIISQYQDSLIQLSGTIEAGALMGLNGEPSFLFTLQDSNYLGTKKLIFNGGVYNDFKRTLNGSFLEIKQEDLTITIQ